MRVRGLSWLGTIALVTAITLIATPGVADDEIAADEGQPLAKPELSGRFTIDYEGRWSDGDTDHDLSQFLSLRAKNLLGEKVSLHAAGRLTEDIGGNQDESSPLRSIWDAYDSDLTGRLYYLYLQIDDPVAEQSKLRLGRQRALESDVVTFDGARYDQSIGRFDFYGFVGARVSHYTHASDDMVYGTGVSVSPWDRTRLRADYLRVGDGHIGTDLVVLGLWQQVIDEVHLYGEYSFIDDKPREARISAIANIPQLALDMEIDYLRSMSTLRELADELSPLYGALWASYPFEQWNFSLHKSFGEHFALFGGVTLHTVLDADDRNTSNRDYEDYQLGLAVMDLLIEGFSVEVFADRWLVSGDENHTELGVEASQEIGEKWSATLGTGFAHYKYEFYEELFRTRESFDVRSYYGEVEWEPRENLQVALRFDAETDETSEDPYYTLGIRCRINF